MRKRKSAKGEFWGCSAYPDQYPHTWTLNEDGTPMVGGNGMGVVCSFYHPEVEKRFVELVGRMVSEYPTLGAMLANAPSREQSEYVVPEMADRYPKGTNMLAPLVQAHFKACGIRVHKPGTGFDILTDKDGKKRRVRPQLQRLFESTSLSHHLGVLLLEDAGAGRRGG